VRDHDGPVRAAVSVVIPARNAAGSLPACLDRLTEQEDPPEFEVVVVDDGSTDATADVAGSHRLRPKVVRGEARGSYAARNAGAAATTGEVLAFTDADCLPRAGWLAAGYQAAGAGGLDVAGGAIRMLPGPGTPAARYDRGSYLRQEDYVTAQGFAATANCFVRRTAFDALGGFSPDLCSGGDVDFGRRAAAAGFRIGYAAGAVVEHPPRTSYTELWAVHRRIGAGWAALARRGEHPAWWRDPGLRYPTLGMVVDTLAASGETARRRELLAAHLTVRAARLAGRLTGR
jgi:glycosyltransferase involved in cell wall biosynthesis